MPVMVSRLAVSLGKTVDDSLVQVWDGDHFTLAGSDVHEMMDFAGPLSSQPPFFTTSPLSIRFETVLSSSRSPESSLGSVRINNLVMSCHERFDFFLVYRL